MPATRFRSLRIGLVGSLILATVWGLDGRASVAWATPQLSQLAATATVVAVCVLATAYVVRLLARVRPRRRKMGDDLEHVIQMPMTRWDRVQLLGGSLVVVALIVGAVWLLGSRFGSHEPGFSPRAPTVRATPPVPVGTRDHQQGQTLGNLGPWILVVTLGLLALAILVVTLRHRVGRGSATPTGPMPSSATPRPPARPVAGGDVRSAVIACYRAFEQEAADRGVLVDPPETAQEIGRGAVGAQIAAPAAVRDLTSLFHRARYSSAALTEADRAEATRLLGMLRDQMRSSG